VEICAGRRRRDGLQSGVADRIDLGPEDCVFRAVLSLYVGGAGFRNRILDFDSGCAHDEMETVIERIMAL
jgi:hypothetical protein